MMSRWNLRVEVPSAALVSHLCPFYVRYITEGAHMSCSPSEIISCTMLSHASVAQLKQGQSGPYAVLGASIHAATAIPLSSAPSIKA